jgi:hypothetical protein
MLPLPKGDCAKEANLTSPVPSPGDGGLSFVGEHDADALPAAACRATSELTV